MQDVKEARPICVLAEGVMGHENEHATPTRSNRAPTYLQHIKVSNIILTKYKYLHTRAVVDGSPEN